MTAHRLFTDFQALEPSVVFLQGGFDPDGTDPVGNVVGKGFSVARTGVGIFTVTLADAYSRLLSIKVDMQLASTDDKFAHVGTVDFSIAAPTFLIRVRDISDNAAADITGAAGNTIRFFLVLQNSSVR